MKSVWVALCLLLLLSLFAHAEEQPEQLPPAFNHFWESGLWVYENQYVLKLGSLSVWSPQFQSTLDSLQLDEWDILSGNSLESMLGDAEKKDLGTVAYHLKNANSFLSKAKSERDKSFILSKNFQDMSLARYAVVLVATSWGGPVTMALGTVIAFGILDFKEGVDYVNNYPVSWKSSMSNSFSSLEEADIAANNMLNGVLKKYGELERMGAGSENYTGEAKEAFLSTSQLFSAISYWKENKANIGGETTGGKYVEISSSLNDLSSYLSKSPDDPSFSQFNLPFMPNSIAGKDSSIILLLLDDYRTLESARVAMEDEYSSAVSSAEAKSQSTSSLLSSLSSDSLNLIDYNALLFTDEKGEVLMGEEVGSIAERLSTANNIHREALSSLSNAKNTHARKGKYYLSDAISLSSSALSLEDRTSLLLEQIDKEASEAVTSAETKAKSELENARGAIDSFSPSSVADDLLKKSANEKYNEASSLYSKATISGKRGERFSLLLQSIGEAKKAAYLISDSSMAAELEKQDILSALFSFESAIQKAETDGIDVSSDRIALSNHKQLISGGLFEEETYAHIINEMNIRTQSIYAKAASIYSSLPEKRDGILELISFFPSQATSFDETERLYVRNDEISFPAALGNLKALENTYNRILLNMEKEKDSVVKKRMEESALAITTTPDSFYLDKSSTITASIYLSNDLPLSLTELTPVEISLAYSFLSSDILSSSPEITDITYSSSERKLVLYFSSIAPLSSYSIHLQKAVTPARTTAVGESIDFLSQFRADITKTVSFTADEDLPSLFAEITLPSSSLNANAFLNGLPLEGEHKDNETLLLPLSSVSQGKNTLTISYSIENPYGVDKTGMLSTAGDTETVISYELKISDVLHDFSNLKIESLDEANSSVSSFNIISKTGHGISNIAHSVSPAGLLYSFDIDRLSKGDEALFSVIYTADSSSQYAQSLLDNLEPAAKASNDPAIISAWNDANSLAQTGSYQNAIRKLLLLQQLILDSQRSDALLLDEIEKEKSSLHSAQQSLNDTAQLLLSYNLTVEGNKALKQLGQSLSMEQEADSLISSGDLEEALSSMRNAKSSLSIDVPKITSSLLSSLSSSYNGLKEKWLLLSVEDENISSSFLQIDQNLRTINELHASSDDEDAIPLLGETNSLLSSVNQSISSLIQMRISTIQSDISSFDERRAAFNSILDKYNTERSLLSSKAASFSLILTKNEISSKLSSIDKAVDKVKKGLKDESYLFKNKEDIDSFYSALNSFDSLDNSTRASLSYLSQLASSSLNTAESAVEELDKKMPDNEDYKTRIRSLKADIEQSRGYLDGEQYANSLILSEKIPTTASGLLLSIAPPSDNKGILIAVASLVLIALVAALFILKKKPKAPLLGGPKSPTRAETGKALKKVK